MAAPPPLPTRLLARCRGCGANIYWAESTRGKAIPLDAEPAEGGNLVLQRRLDGVLVAMVVKADEMPGAPRFVSHFSTCVDAAKFRRARKPSGAMRLR